MNGNDPGVISQQIPTTPGRSYVLRFAIAGNVFCLPNVKTLQVLWGGSSVATVTFDDTGYTATNMGWTYKTYQVSATSASTQLQFASLTQNSLCGPTLDDLSVTRSNNLVQDAGFESPPAPTGWYSEYKAGQTIGPWTVASGSVKLGTGWTAVEGAQSVDLSGSGAGAVYQDVPTTPGQSYDLRFAVAADPFCPPTTKTLQVSWGGNPIATVSVDDTGKTFSNMGWTDKTYSVTATSSSSRLEFASMSDSACGPTVDAVSVIPTNSADSLTWQPRAPMLTGRRYLSVVRARNGLIYAVGGANDNLTQVFSTLEAYDPATNTWSTKASMPTARYDLGLAEATNGKIYAVGGATYYCCGYTAAVEEYDPATNHWVTRASLPSAMAGLALVGARNGKIYAIGGWTTGTVATVYAYDPASNTWMSRAGMPTPRADLAAVEGRDGLIYAVGGINPWWTNPLTTVEAYDPTTDTWSTRASLVTPTNHFGLTQEPGGTIFAIGGQDGSGNPMDAVQSFDSATNSWQSQTSLPFALDGLGAATGRNRGIYVIGGNTPTGILTTNEVGGVEP